MFNHKPCKEICCFPNSAELTSLLHWHARYTCQLWSPIFLKVPSLYSLWERLFSNNTIAWFTIFIFPPEPFLLNVTGYGKQGKLHRNTLGACSERILTRTGSGFFVVRSSASFEASTNVQKRVWSSVRGGTAVLLPCRAALPQPQRSKQKVQECSTSENAAHLATFQQVSSNNLKVVRVLETVLRKSYPILSQL